MKVGSPKQGKTANAPQNSSLKDDSTFLDNLEDESLNLKEGKECKYF
jgi:hypothetical protein